MTVTIVIISYFYCRNFDSPPKVGIYIYIVSHRYLYHNTLYDQNFPPPGVHSAAIQQEFPKPVSLGQPGILRYLSCRSCVVQYHRGHIPPCEWEKEHASSAPSSERRFGHVREWNHHDTNGRHTERDTSERPTRRVTRRVTMWLLTNPTIPLLFYFIKNMVCLIWIT